MGTPRVIKSGRLAPKLVQIINALGEEVLFPLRDELEEAERTDPFRPPRPKPPPTIDI